MKNVSLLLCAAVALCNCKSPKATQTTTASESADKRRNVTSYSGSARSSDSVILSGTEFIPLHGKSEYGTPADLEGFWILASAPGAKGLMHAELDTIFSKKKPAPGTEISRDSVTSTERVNGVTQTTTTVQIERIAEKENRFTPPQGSTYHIPEKPSINFFGANETFSGYTGCNKFSGRYSLGEKNSISMTNATASTKMACIGNYDEEAYLNTLHKVNHYRATASQLELLDGETVLLTFSKK